MRPSRSKPLSVLAQALLVALFITAQPAAAQDDVLKKAIETYLTGDFQAAADQFAKVAYDPQAPEEIRRNALQYLGRTYLAQNHHTKMRDVIASLIGLEPPIVELDPDVEAPPMMKAYYEIRKEEADDYGEPRADPGVQTLAVIDFTNSSIDDRARYEPLERGFPSMMIHNLSGTTDLKVIERERIQWLLDELNLQKDPELIDQSKAVRAGKLLGAHAVLIGSYTVHGRQIWISSRLVKVETGEIIFSEQILGKPDRFFELIEKLSLQVAQAINVNIKATDLGSRTETRSLDAVMSYSEGLQFLESEKYRAAYEKFKEALEYDPNYKRAELKAESLRPMLALADASPAAPTDGN